MLLKKLDYFKYALIATLISVLVGCSGYNTPREPIIEKSTKIVIVGQKSSNGRGGGRIVYVEYIIIGFKSGVVLANNISNTPFSNGTIYTIMMQYDGDNVIPITDGDVLLARIKMSENNK